MDTGTGFDTMSNTGENLQSSLNCSAGASLLTLNATRMFGYPFRAVPESPRTPRKSRSPLEAGFHPLDVNTASGGMMHEGGGQTCRQGMQDEFHRIGSTIFSQEHRGLVCIEDEGRCSGRGPPVRRRKTL